MVRVKICGITNIEDALAAAEYGADALGFVFVPGSPRYIPPEKAAEIIAYLPAFITTIGVFVNEDPERLKKICETSGIDIAQFHGDEPPQACSVCPRAIKAFRIKDFTDLNLLGLYRTSALLLDAYAPDSYGGTGQIFNWDIAVEAKRFGKIILSGGLNPDNIEKAVKWVMPYAVDVSSGVEASKGKKDLSKMRAFIERAKRAVLKL